MRAFIHTVSDAPFNEECASAQRGFELLGVEVVPFSSNDTLDLATENDVVVGGMLVCSHALAMQGVAVPCIDYPYNLREFFGREIGVSAAGSIRPADLPVFVKPVVEKELPASVVRAMEDLNPYLEMGEEYPLYVSEPVKFVSEWRCFVRYRRVLGATHYCGDPEIEPDWIVASHAIDHFYSGRPNGYGIDLGVTEDGRTLVVEVNDGFALGSYGLDDVAYALLLSARWSQLMGVKDELHDVADPVVNGPIAKAMASQRWSDYRFGKPGESIPACEPDLPRWVWSVVANVSKYEYGTTADESAGKRKGTKHFAAGTKVWIMEPYWSWDGRLLVVGKEKGTHRLIRKVMDESQLENFRVKRVYSPTVISWMQGARNEIPNFSHCGKYWSEDLFCITLWSYEDAKMFVDSRNKMNAGIH